MPEKAAHENAAVPAVATVSGTPWGGFGKVTIERLPVPEAQSQTIV